MQNNRDDLEKTTHHKPSFLSDEPFPEERDPNQTPVARQSSDGPKQEKQNSQPTETSAAQNPSPVKPQSHPGQREIPVARPALSGAQPKTQAQPRQPVPSQTDSPVHPHPAQTNLVARLLSPENLQKMMAASGIVLVIGIVTWLWSVGVFEEPITVAVISGVVSLSVIAAGCTMVLLTRFNLAGTGLTLLGCLALPLNLWLYDSQDLITLQNGGHLWIPSALICGIYAAVAKLLKDSKLIYALVGGILLTGSLILADNSVSLFWNPVYHIAFLFVIGWSCNVSTFLFSKENKEFSQANFGLAFFRSGLITLLAATIGTMAMHTVPFLLSSFIPPVYHISHQEILVLSTFLLISSISSFITNHFFIKSKILFFLGIAQSFQLAMVALSFFEISLNFMLIAALASISLSLFNILLLVSGNTKQENRNRALTVGSIVLAKLSIFQFVCLAADYQTSLFCSSHLWLNTLAFGTTCLATITTLIVTTKGREKNQVEGFRFLSVLASVVGVGFTISVASLLSLQVDYSLLAVTLPVLLSIGTLIHRHNPFVAQGYAAAVVGSIVTVVGCYFLLPFSESAVLTLSHPLAWNAIYQSICMTVFTISLFVAARSVAPLSYAAAACLCLGIGSWLNCFGAAPEIIVILPLSLTGIAWQLYLLAENTDQGESRKSLENNPGEIVLNFGFVATILYAFYQLVSLTLENQISGGAFALVSTQTLLAGGQSFLYRNRSESTAANVLFGLLFGFSIFLGLSFFQLSIGYRIECILIAAGVGMTIFGHWRWIQDPTKNRTLSSGLNIVGCALIGLPVLASLLAHRIVFDSPTGTWVHEILALVTGVTLLHTGILFKFRSTTLSGITVLGTYILSLAMYIPIPEQLKSASVMMIIAGGSVFGLAVVLSIYRDWILEVPKKIQKGEGPFQFLNWKQ